MCDYCGDDPPYTQEDIDDAMRQDEEGRRSLPDEILDEPAERPHGLSVNPEHPLAERLVMAGVGNFAWASPLERPGVKFV